MDKVDILVIGTGISGRQAVRYLSSHPSRSKFSFAIAGRSQHKLDVLSRLASGVATHVIDVTDAPAVDELIQKTGVRVVINTVGPYWLYGTPVVKAVVKYGRDYVDLTGEVVWIREIIKQFDYQATKTGSIVVPCCGIDSIPSDLCAYLGVKTLTTTLGHELGQVSSTGVAKISGKMSGGTAASIVSEIGSGIPRHIKSWARSPFALSPILPSPATRPPPKLIYTLQAPGSSEPIVGGIFLMSGINKAVVERSWGLSQLYSTSRYPRQFKYDEFMATPTRLHGLLVSLALIGAVIALRIPGLNWFMKQFVLPKEGEGPGDEQVKIGKYEITNVTAAEGAKEQAVTMYKGKGDPGYYLSPVMMVECALTLLLQRKELPSEAQRGGILTPAAAFGDVLVHRLNDTGIMELRSEVVQA